MKFDVQNSNRSIYIVTCKNLNCPRRLYARALATGIWEVTMNPFHQTCYGHAIRENHCQITSNIIMDLMKLHLRDNLNMTISHTRGLVEIKIFHRGCGIQ
jgi:hypothetical protein